MKIVTVTLSKGGVGKTTVASNLAEALALAGSRVLLIDTDSQGQIAVTFGIDRTDGLKRWWFNEDPFDSLLVPHGDNLLILPGGPETAYVQADIERELGETAAQSRPIVMRRLRERLRAYEDIFDYVIVDTSPGGTIRNVAAASADILLLPVGLGKLEIDGFTQYFRQVLEEHGAGKQIVIVPNRYDLRDRTTTMNYGRLLQDIGLSDDSMVRDCVLTKPLPVHRGFERAIDGPNPKPFIGRPDLHRGIYGQRAANAVNEMTTTLMGVPA